MPDRVRKMRGGGKSEEAKLEQRFGRPFHFWMVDLFRFLEEFLVG